MTRRLYTVAGRDGTVIITDSKVNPKTGKGSLFTYNDCGKDTQLCAIKAINRVLSVIPRPTRQFKFADPVTFLLPRFVEFLKYEDTRTYWISKGVKKNGDVIAPELLEEVVLFDKQVKELGVNLQIFGQSKLTSPTFKTYIASTWRAMDSIVPPAVVETVDANYAY